MKTGIKGYWFYPGQDPVQFDEATPEESRVLGSYVYYPYKDEWYVWELRNRGIKGPTWHSPKPGTIPKEYLAWALLL